MALNDYLEMASKGSLFSQFNPKKIARLIFDAANEIDHEEYQYYMEDMMDAIHKEISILVKQAEAQERRLRGK